MTDKPDLKASPYSPNSTWLVALRLDTTPSTCRASRDERIEPCCSNMADDKQAIVLAYTSLVVLSSYIQKCCLFRQML